MYIQFGLIGGLNFIPSLLNHVNKTVLKVVLIISQWWVELCSKFDVRLFKAKNMVVRVRLPKDEHVRVRLMFESVGCEGLLCSMSVCLKPKFRCLSSIINRWTCSSSFVVQKITLEFSRCLMKCCLIHHYFLLYSDCRMRVQS